MRRTVNSVLHLPNGCCGWLLSLLRLWILHRGVFFVRLGYVSFGIEGFVLDCWTPSFLSSSGDAVYKVMSTQSKCVYANQTCDPEVRGQPVKYLYLLSRWSWAEYSSGTFQWNITVDHSVCQHYVLDGLIDLLDYIQSMGSMPCSVFWFSKWNSNGFRFLRGNSFLWLGDISRRN